MKNNWPHIRTPMLVVDEMRVRRNIDRMVQKARKHDKTLRPHFKTHQSRAIGQWFRDAGVSKITVSSVGMAEYFAADGWNDITVAFPFNVRMADRVRALAEKITVNVLVDNIEVAEWISRNIAEPVHIFIEVDAGSGRTGVPFGDSDRLNALATVIRASERHIFEGIYTHSGHTYGGRSAEEVRKTGRNAIANMENAAASIDGSVPRVCYGDTPSCTLLEDFGTIITDLSPGNFVFYDMMQVGIGTCTVDDIGVAVLCPVVSHPDVEGRWAIHGGAVHFSKDRLDDGTFGALVTLQDSSWSDEICGELSAISQEHGIVDSRDALEIGEVIAILPVHSCLTAECMEKYLTTRGVYLDHYQKSR